MERKAEGRGRGRSETRQTKRKRREEGGGSEAEKRMAAERRQIESRWDSQRGTAGSSGSRKNVSRKAEGREGWRDGEREGWREHVAKQKNSKQTNCDAAPGQDARVKPLRDKMRAF